MDRQLTIKFSSPDIVSNVTTAMQDCLRSLAGYQERPHFLLEFAPGGSRHEELVTDKPVEELKAEEANSRVNELPDKMNEFLQV